MTLGFGMLGGVMGDFVGDAVEPVPADLYRSLLLHPIIKPYTDAFQIDADPPSWLNRMEISEFESRNEDFETWSNKSRCLLLDRERRQFFVGSVSKIRTWLILRGLLYSGRKVRNRLCIFSEAAVQKLFAWLDEQAPVPLSAQFVAEWESKFHQRQAIAACTAAGFSLGFEADDVRSLMILDAFRNRES